jgi:hypothetical protein
VDTIIASKPTRSRWQQASTSNMDRRRYDPYWIL